MADSADVPDRDGPPGGARHPGAGRRSGDGTRSSGPVGSHTREAPARHAVVVGGSVAGLLTAQVLTDHADRVTVIERDRYPDGPEPRAGVPQSRHIHVLLEGGARALDELLPGVVAELCEHGAPRVGMPHDLVHWQAGRFYRRTAATVDLLTGSRPLLEWLIRRRVLANPRITVRSGTQAVGLLGDAVRVRGVRLRERGARAEPRSLAADLVVDASGRGSRAARWLDALGAEPVREEEIDTGLTYASRIYRAPEVPTWGRAAGCYFVPDSRMWRGAVALPVEDGRYLVTLSGLRGSEPPAAEDAFVDFAARLPHPVLYDWLREAHPDSPVHTFHSTANLRRRYDLSGRRPAGFLAVGDALCAVNPVYGQGMTVAALGALAVRDALADGGSTPTTARVQRALLRASRQAWDIAAGADKDVPGARGNASGTRAWQRPVSWYLARVVRRAPGDPIVGGAFRAACALTAPSSALFAPPVLRAVLFGPPKSAPAEPPPPSEPVSG